MDENHAGSGGGKLEQFGMAMTSYRDLLLLAGVLAIVALPVAVNAQETKLPCAAAAKSYIDKAKTESAAGNATSAAETLRQAIRVDARCSDAFLFLGLTEFHSGDTAAAIEHYREAVKLSPRSYSGHYNLALAYLKQKNVPAARRHLEKAVLCDPKQADAAYDLGLVLLSAGETKQAISHLRNARALNPGRPDVSFNLVRGDLESGNQADARKDAEFGARRLAADFQWNAAVGELFFQHALAEDAAKYLRQANVIRPESVEVRSQLATAYLGAHQAENVLTLISEPTTGGDHFLRGSAFYQAHRFTEADQESQTALALEPDDPKILVLRIRLLQRAGQQNAALEIAERAKQLAADWDEPFYLAGISNYFIRHYTEARQNLARAFELNPKSAATAFVESLAWAGEGNRHESELSLRRAIALQPGNARFQCHMGILLLRQNLPQQAEEFLQKAVQLKPQYALPHYELGKLRVQSKQWKEAGDELEKTIALDPGFTSAYYQLGLIYTRLGEKEKSEQMMAQFQKLHQLEMDDSAAIDNDAREVSDSQ